MKFLQLKYREKQSDWFGKRGLSWHISTVITLDPNLEGRLEMRSYAHLFDACRQDWFAVCSIVESTLREIETQKPHITRVYQRSNEAGCHHNNSLVAAARGIGKRVGLEVYRYDFSEPQYGKDVCDQILCPMKTCIRRFCNEGHDILLAGDMRKCTFWKTNERHIRMRLRSWRGEDNPRSEQDRWLCKLHNVQFEEKGIRVRRSYGIGRGKEISFDQLVLKR